MLILKSLAENDTETLMIFGKLGIQFSVLNEIPEISSRLSKAFPEDFRFTIPCPKRLILALPPWPDCPAIRTNARAIRL
jgi:hypothetical protein